MPFPTHVGSQDFVIMAAGDDEGFNTKCGPYLFGGSLWCVAAGPVTAPAPTLHVFKSTDNGTTWTEQDVAHAPLYGQDSVAPFLFLTYTVAQDANNTNRLYVTFWHTDHTLRCEMFDMSTGLWSTVFGSALVYLSANVGIAGLTSVFRPSDGVLVVALASGNVNGANFDRPYYATLNTGTGVWSALLAMGPIGGGDNTTWSNFGSALGNANAVHFFMSNNQGGGNVRILQQALHTDGTLSALQVVIGVTKGLSEATAGGSHQVAGQAEVFFGAVVSPPGGPAVYSSWRAISADAPVWTQEVIFTNTLPAVILSSQLALTDVAGILTCFYWTEQNVAGFPPSLFMSQNSGLGWGTSSLIQTFATGVIVNSTSLAAGLGASYGLLVNNFFNPIHTMGFFGGASPGGVLTLCFKGQKIYG